VASTLVALFGPKRGVRLLLDGPTVVGRSSTAALQLIDGKVSREHCGSRSTVRRSSSRISAARTAPSSMARR